MATGDCWGEFLSSQWATLKSESLSFQIRMHESARMAARLTADAERGIMVDMIEQVSSDTQMKDFEAHVTAVEADLEYWRVKRIEPRMLHFVRRNILPLHALFATAARMGTDGAGKPISIRSDGKIGEEEHNHEHEHKHEALEERIRGLEDRLDDYVRAIALAATDPGKVDFVIDDSRTESGAYDPFFKFTKRAHGGSLEERLAHIREPIDISILGCVVNGIGEGKEADIGIAGGKESGLLFRKGKVVRKIKESEMLDVLVKEVEALVEERQKVKN